MWGANATEWGNYFCSWGPSWGHGPWFMGWLFPLLFWGLIAYLAVSIIRGLFSSTRSKQNDNALEILRNRFAAGEIDEKEYNAQKAVLSRS
ncbi:MULTISPECIES: SHOCT domain-containing protein [Desulfosediminicola]|uniref:SHOCT domain-containing protein n=1 Tax=Desulfosediminicola TaxID=2886823 RepID=UPI0010AC445F|nr:SHOCT domain-containing protein [Desulfosediminicola ganghwensis]